MSILLASDLYLDRIQSTFRGEKLIGPSPHHETQVLAGNIANGAQAFELFNDWPFPAFYIAGPHEFRGRDYEETLDELSQRPETSSLIFLENQVHVDLGYFGAVRFLGCTLWSDATYSQGRDNDEQMRQVQSRIYDRYAIRFKGGSFSVVTAARLHWSSVEWLKSELTKPFDGKTVVISHHAPHPQSIHPRHAGNPLNAAYTSNLRELMSMVDVWVNGGTEDSVDYYVDGCHIVANPLGRVTNLSHATHADELKFRNKTFHPRCRVEWYDDDFSTRFTYRGRGG